MISRALMFARKIARYIYRLYNYSRLRNKNFTLIAKDCTGALLLHELFQKFDTPTVNLWFTAPDFVKFCRDLEYYISQELIEDKENSAKVGYPIATLGSGEREIHVWFLHYDNYSDARAKWLERSKRIHWDNLYFIMTDGEGCDENVAREFDAIPRKHKALLTHRDFPGVKSAVKLNILKPTQHGIGAPEVCEFKSRFSIGRVIDDWDYIAFLNSR